MATIFLSYRRDDTAGVAGRIYDRLKAHFGLDDVFMDVDAIPFGADFRKHINKSLRRCKVALVLIGPRWAGEATGGGRRIDDETDPVRLEVEAALRRKLLVIPVLIDQTRMPGAADLPTSLTALAYRNGPTLSQGRDFDHHVNRLIRAIGSHLKRPDPAAGAPPTGAVPPVPIAPRVEEKSRPERPEPSATTDPPRFTNSLGMTLVRIEPGEFLMGSTEAQIDTLMMEFPGAEPGSYDDEQPQHPVTITWPFYLGGHPVTVGQFRRFVEASGYETEAESSGLGASGLVGREWKQDKRITWRNPGFKQGENHPVVCVSHNDAVAFLAWLNDEETGSGWTYRLPTEAEWEYACRAGTVGLYGGSDDPESLVLIANVADASFKKKYPRYLGIQGDDGYVYTAPVGSFAPNAWGLYDLLGNVWEWCDDYYDAAFYKSSPTEDPRNATRALKRLIRGGSWSSDPCLARSAYRNEIVPRHRDNYLGFRVARGRSGP
jgi:formylglycine-generating enzyme required for sulfatase activity